MAFRAKPSLRSSYIAVFFLAFLPPLFSKCASAFLTSNDCRWPDGTDSHGRIPCDPDAERSPCCLGTETCLENGLCFGGVGLIYRSACAGGWGDDNVCPEFCNDLLPHMWANIWPCPGRGDEGPTQFWCGNGDVCDKGETGNSSFFAIENYKFQGKNIIGGPIVSTATVGASATATSIAATAPAASQTECRDVADNPPALAVGAGVGVPLAILAMALGGWALIERRKRKRSLGAVSSTDVTDVMQAHPVGYLGARVEKAELSSISPYRNNQDACSSRHELQ